MKERLLRLLEVEKLTALKFSEIMEVRPSNISHILSGRNNPGFDFISRLLLRFPAVNPDWLINGVGAMYRDGLIDDSQSTKHDNMNYIIDNKVDTHLSTLISERPVDLSVEKPNNLFSLNDSIVDEFEQQPLTLPVLESQVAPQPNLNQAEPTSKSLQEQQVSNHTEPPTKSLQEQVLNHAEPTSKSPQEQSLNLTQILMFFDDNTFKIYTPRK